MKKLFAVLFVSFSIIGCVKEIPAPWSNSQFPLRNIINITGDTTICHYSFSGNFLVNAQFDMVDSSYWVPMGYGGSSFYWELHHDTLEIGYLPFDTGIVFLYNLLDGDTSVTYITLIECSQTLYLPSGFTPDSDGINDFWKPVFSNVHTMEWKIYNSDGNEVFDSEGNLDAEWDGTCDGLAQPEGLYRYRVNHETIDNPEIIFTEGWVQLYRNE
jgi:gliding motility-associated-like protein